MRITIAKGPTQPESAAQPPAAARAPLTTLLLVALWAGAGCRSGEHVVEIGPCCAESGTGAAAAANCDAGVAGSSACSGAALSAPAAGMRAYVDPKTGELLEKPPAGAAVPPPGAAGSDAVAPAKIKPVPGGGVMLENGAGLRQY